MSQTESASGKQSDNIAPPAKRRRPEESNGENSATLKNVSSPQVSDHFISIISLKGLGVIRTCTRRSVRSMFRLRWRMIIPPRCRTLRDCIWRRSASASDTGEVSLSAVAFADHSGSLGCRGEKLAVEALVFARPVSRRSLRWGMHGQEAWHRRDSCLETRTSHDNS